MPDFQGFFKWLQDERAKTAGGNPLARKDYTKLKPFEQQQLVNAYNATNPQSPIPTGPFVSQTVGTGQFKTDIKAPAPFTLGEQGGKSYINPIYNTSKVNDVFSGALIGAQMAGQTQDPFFRLGSVVGGALVGLFTGNLGGAYDYNVQKAAIDEENKLAMATTQAGLKIAGSEAKLSGDAARQQFTARMNLYREERAKAKAISDKIKSLENEIKDSYIAIRDTQDDELRQFFTDSLTKAKKEYLTLTKNLTPDQQNKLTDQQVADLDIGIFLDTTVKNYGNVKARYTKDGDYLIGIETKDGKVLPSDSAEKELAKNWNQQNGGGWDDQKAADAWQRATNFVDNNAAIKAILNDLSPVKRKDRRVALIQKYADLLGKDKKLNGRELANGGFLVVYGKDGRLVNLLPDDISNTLYNGWSPVKKVEEEKQEDVPIRIDSSAPADLTVQFRSENPKWQPNFTKIQEKYRNQSSIPALREDIKKETQPTQKAIMQARLDQFNKIDEALRYSPPNLNELTAANPNLVTIRETINKTHDLISALDATGQDILDTYRQYTEFSRYFREKVGKLPFAELSDDYTKLFKFETQDGQPTSPKILLDTEDDKKILKQMKIKDSDMGELMNSYYTVIPSYTNEGLDFIKRAKSSIDGFKPFVMADLPFKGVGGTTNTMKFYLWTDDSGNEFLAVFDKFPVN